MILDITYFKGELYLPNLKLNVSDPVGHSAKAMQTIGENDMGWYVAKYEEDFLIKLLGNKLFTNFIDGLNGQPVNPIWTNLKDAIYEVKDGYKFSPAANYVFYWVSRRGRTKTAVQGEVIETLDYALNTSDADKLCKVYNDMCDMVKRFHCDFLSEKWEDYKEYADEQICCNKFEYINKWNI